jgi:WD40 repeat protein
MPQNWYYAAGEQKLGPYSASQLRQLATTGQLRPTDMVWKEGMKQWAAAGSVKGLFPPTADRPPAVASPPTSEPSPSAPAAAAQGGVLGEAKGLLRSVGKLIAAQAQDAVKSAREATEAKARAVGRRLPAPRRAYAPSSLPKRQIWLLAAAFVAFSVLGLCVAGGIVTTGLQTLAPKPANKQNASAAEDDGHQWLRRIELPGKASGGAGGGAGQLAFLPDGKRFLSLDDRGDLSLWDSESGEELRHIRHEALAFLLALSPDGKFALLSASEGILLLNVETGQKEYSFGKGAVSLGVSPDGRRAFFAKGHARTEVRGRAINVDGQQTDDAGEIVMGGYDFHKDLKTIFTGSTVHIFDLKSREEVRQFQGPDSGTWGFTFSPDGRRCIARFVELHSEGVVNALVGPSMRLYDLESGQMLLGFTEPPAKISVGLPVFSPDGRLALSGHKDGSVCIWTTDTGKILRTCKGHDGRVIAVAFLPDGKRILTGGEDKTVRLWDVATGKEIARFDHPDSVLSVAVSPDGKLAVSGCSDRALYLWKLP